MKKVPVKAPSNTEDFNLNQKESHQFYLIFIFQVISTSVSPSTDDDVAVFNPG